MAVDIKKAETLANQIRSSMMDMDIKIAELQNMGFTTRLTQTESGMHVFNATVTQEVNL